MDLGTVQNNMNKKHYRYVEGVLNDIQLIWENSKLFNADNKVNSSIIKGISKDNSEMLNYFSKNGQKLSSKSRIQEKKGHKESNRKE